MKEYTLQAKAFYHSKIWQKTRKIYLSSVNFVCERCGKPAEIVHHKIPIDSSNITDQNILLGFDNLEALCFECHNKEHFSTGRENKYIFDASGNLIYSPPPR